MSASPAPGRDSSAPGQDNDRRLRASGLNSSASSSGVKFFGFAARCAEKLCFSASLQTYRGSAAPPAAEPHDNNWILRKSVAFPHTERASRKTHDSAKALPAKARLCESITREGSTPRKSETGKKNPRKPGPEARHRQSEILESRTLRNRIALTSRPISPVINITLFPPAGASSNACGSTATGPDTRG